ncbi:MAG TPA: ROK family protein [Solirubrobacteraceae bacterium]|nr:ROK family protein [Solirubrobacteraceae bacterium]
MKGQFIGLDVGGTKIASATLQDGRLTPGETVKTDVSDSDALVGQLVSLIEHARSDATIAVGIGLPSIIEFATGRIRHSVNIPLGDLPLRQLLTDRVGIPVYVENDASCAALAEAFDEEGNLVCPDLVMFTVGTGVGGGLVLGGRLYRGTTSAAELGHTVIGLDLEHGAPVPEGRHPLPGTLEYLAAGRALDRLAEREARDEEDSFLGRRLAADGEVTGHDVVDGANAGDADALRVLDVLGQRLGVGIANAINTFDPHEVVIGGGVSTAGNLLLVPARETARRYTVPGVGRRTTIRLARHGVRAGVLGAAMVAAQEEEKG